MQVPKRKAGEYSQIKADPYMTRAEIMKLEQELEKLKMVKRPRVAKEMQEHAEHGDFSENHAYQMAKGRLRGINARIDEIERILKNAILIEEGSPDGIIGIGSTVTVSMNGVERTYQILGSQETDPSFGKISHLSPIGMALKGHAAGEVITVVLGDEEKEIIILKVD